MYIILPTQTIVIDFVGVSLSIESLYFTYGNKQFHKIIFLFQTSIRTNDNHWTLLCIMYKIQEYLLLTLYQSTNRQQVTNVLRHHEMISTSINKTVETIKTQLVLKRPQPTHIASLDYKFTKFTYRSTSKITKNPHFIIKLTLGLQQLSALDHLTSTGVHILHCVVVFFKRLVSCQLCTQL